MKELEAEIILEYEDAKSAENIAKGVSPDNFEKSRFFIRTTREGNEVLTYIHCKGKLSTLIATIDDLLFCITLAEKVCHIVKKMNGDLNQFHVKVEK